MVNFEVGKNQPFLIVLLKIPEVSFCLEVVVVPIKTLRPNSCGNSHSLIIEQILGI